MHTYIPLNIEKLGSAEPMDYISLAAIGIVAVFLLWTVAMGLKIVRPTQRGLVERFGKYHRFVNQGMTLLVPFVDRIIHVNITERMTPVEPQEIITKDKVFLKTDAVIFYKIKPDEESVKASEYNVANFQSQIDVLARTVLRDIIGSKDMSDANTSRADINAKLLEQLRQLTNSWGIEITRAEIKDIVPPQELITSMESVLKADNTRQAAEKTAIAVATQAKGEADAAINSAQGQKQASILKAEGERQSAILVAEGQAKATELTNTALTTYFKDNAVLFKQLDTVRDSLMNNTKMIVPQGNALSLILDERDNLNKGTILPVGNGKAQEKPPMNSDD